MSCSLRFFVYQMILFIEAINITFQIKVSKF